MRSEIAKPAGSDAGTTGAQSPRNRAPTVQHKTPLRRLDSSDPESIRRLTAFLDVVYGDRAKKGIDYLRGSQTEESTLRMIQNKECWVAEIGGQIVGSFAVSTPENTRGSWWYRQPGVAEVSQLAVHPSFRMLGLFPLLMDAAEQRAVELGAVEVAGSAPSQRKRLIQAYLRRGHRIVDYKWPKNSRYGCIIFSKTLQGGGIKCTLFRRMLRRIKYLRRAARYKLPVMLRRSAG